MPLKAKWQNALAWLKTHSRQLLVLAALLHGLFYVFAIPPWWHYEEGPHFEYAWVMAHPEEKGASVPSIRVEIARSMLRSGWAEYVNLRPDALKNPESLFIGYSQYDDSPLYYWLASLPLRLLTNTSVDIQLYAARMVSLLLMLLAILLADHTLTLLQAPERVHLLTLAFLAAAPSWMDSMVAVHNDPLGALASVAYLCATLETIRRPKRAHSWLFLLVASLLALYGSNPSRALLASLVLLPLFIFWQQRQTPFKKQVLVIAGLLVLSGIAFFHTPVPKSWIGFATQPGITLRPKTYVDQIIPPSQTEYLHEQPLTLAATFTAPNKIPRFIWGYISVRYNNYRQRLFARIPTNTSFPAGVHTVSFTFSIPKEAHILQLRVAAPPNTSITWENIRLEYDGQNILRNPDGQKTAWSFSWPQIEKHLGNVYQPSILAEQIQDWATHSWYYQMVGHLLLQGLWGRLAGNLVALPGAPQTYQIFNFLGGIIGILALWQLKNQLHRLPSLQNWVLSVFFLILIMVILRGGASIYAPALTVPYIRYLLPGFVPLAWLFALGLSRLPLPVSLSALGFWALLGMYAISDFYHPVFVTPARFILAVGLGLGAAAIFLLLWKGNAHAD